MSDDLYDTSELPHIDSDGYLVHEWGLGITRKLLSQEQREGFAACGREAVRLAIVQQAVAIRVEQAMARVDCPYCGADMVDNQCPGCGHDPAIRRVPGVMLRDVAKGTTILGLPSDHSALGVCLVAGEDLRAGDAISVHMDDGKAYRTIS